MFTRGKTILEDHVRNRKGRERPDNCALRAPLSIDSRIKRQLIIPFLLMDLFPASSAFLKARVRPIPLNIHRLRTTAMFVRSDKLYVRGTDMFIGIDERTVTVIRAGTISSQSG